MKSSEEIAESITLRIGHIYFRPLLYGGTPEGVELILHYYHELWSEIFGLQEQYTSARQIVHSEENCGSMGFASRHQKRYPHASRDKTLTYVVRQWRKISKQIGVPVPYSFLRKEFQTNKQLQNLFPEEEP